MKNITKIFAIALVVIASSATAFAQSTATASTTATLVTPISISKTTDMNFGTVASSATAGTIAISSAAVLAPTGGASVISGTPTTAVFHVTGQGTELIQVSYPASISLAGSVSGTLTVNSITADCGTSTNLVDGGKDISFSAVLEVPANTIAGSYTNATGLYVTVNYN